MSRNGPSLALGRCRSVYMSPCSSDPHPSTSRTSTSRPGTPSSSTPRPRPAWRGRSSGSGPTSSSRPASAPRRPCCCTWSRASGPRFRSSWSTRAISSRRPTASSTSSPSASASTSRSTAAPLGPAWQEARWGKLWEQGLDGIERYNRMNKVEPMQRALDELGARGWIVGLRRVAGDVAPPSERPRPPGRLPEGPPDRRLERQARLRLPDAPRPAVPSALGARATCRSATGTRRPKLTDGMAEEETRFFGLKRECGLHESWTPTETRGPAQRGAALRRGRHTSRRLTRDGVSGRLPRRRAAGRLTGRRPSMPPVPPPSDLLDRLLRPGRARARLAPVDALAAGEAATLLRVQDACSARAGSSKVAASPTRSSAASSSPRGRRPEELRHRPGAGRPARPRAADEGRAVTRASTRARS